MPRVSKAPLLGLIAVAICGCACEEDAWSLFAEEVIRVDFDGSQYPDHEVVGTLVGGRPADLDALIGEVCVMRSSLQPPGATVIVTLEDLDTGAIEMRDIGAALDAFGSTGVGALVFGRSCDGSVPCDALRYTVTIESSTGESFDVSMVAQARYLYCGGAIEGEMLLSIVAL